MTIKTEETKVNMGDLMYSLFWNTFTEVDYNASSVDDIRDIEDTFLDAFNECKHNYIALTQLVMVLNHKSWDWCFDNDELSKLYEKLWREADCYAVTYLKDDERRYFFRITD